MGQVPAQQNTQKAPLYLIVGRGRVAQHFSHYLGLLNIPHRLWHRQDSTTLTEKAAQTSHVLLLINDDAIEDFYLSQPLLKNKICIHFSGAMQSKNIIGAHPLYSFGSQLYNLETYKNIPFITELGRPQLKELFPQLNNPSAALPPQKKALYHSYCVMSGNFTTLLWQNLLSDFEKDLGLKPALMFPYMTQIFTNLMTQANDALTGPMVRNDKKTIILHLDALMGRPYQNLYYAFINFYEKTRGFRKKRKPSFFGVTK